LAAKITGQAILLGHDHDFTWSIRQASDKTKPVDERMGLEALRITIIGSISSKFLE